MCFGYQKTLQCSQVRLSSRIRISDLFFIYRQWLTKQCVQINPMGLLLSFSPSLYVRSDLEGMPTGTRLPPELWAPQPRTCPKPPNPAAFAQLLGSEHQPDGAQDKNPHSELITCLSSMQGGNMQDPWTRRPPWILSDVWLPSARNHGRKRLWESCGSCSSPFPEPFY